MSFDRLIKNADKTVMKTMGEFVFHNRGAQSLKLRAVFDENYQSIDADGVMIESVGPVVFCKQTDLINNKGIEGDTFTIRGRRYVLREIHKDSEKGIKILLHRGEY